jgi:hypothetical protein
MTSGLNRRQRYIVAALLLLALALRGFIASRSVGSNDAVTWQEFAEHIAGHGLLRTYYDLDYFNHPPLMGRLSVLALRLGALLHEPFMKVFKAPIIVADVATAGLLWLICCSAIALQASESCSRSPSPLAKNGKRQPRCKKPLNYAET